MKCHAYKYLLVLSLGLVLAFSFCSINPVAAQEKPQFNMLMIREALVKGGKMREAVQFAKEIMEYDRNLLPNSKGRLYMEVFGDYGKIYWIIENKDLATIQNNTRKLRTDPGRRAILQKAAGLFIEGSVHDTLMGAIR